MPADDLDSRDSDFNLNKSSEYVVFRPNHQLMARPQLREVDGRPQRYFFYKRVTDDRVLCFTEAEAAMQMKGSHKFILRQIGCSDGSAYHKFINTCGVKAGDRITLEKAQEILKGAMDAEIQAANGNFDDPMPNNVHFDGSFPMAQRRGFVPPA